jgi:hypothetical protein
MQVTSERAVGSVIVTALVAAIILIISLLLTAPASAFPEDADEAEVILVEPNVNQMIVTTACGEILTITVSVFSGPEGLVGETLLFTHQPDLTPKENRAYMAQIGAKVITDLLPLLAQVKLEETGAWRCA